MPSASPSPAVVTTAQETEDTFTITVADAQAAAARQPHAGKPAPQGKPELTPQETEDTLQEVKDDPSAAQETEDPPAGRAPPLQATEEALDPGRGAEENTDSPEITTTTTKNVTATTAINDNATTITTTTVTTTTTTTYPTVAEPRSSADVAAAPEPTPEPSCMENPGLCGPYNKPPELGSGDSVALTMRARGSVRDYEDVTCGHAGDGRLGAGCTLRRAIASIVGVDASAVRVAVSDLARAPLGCTAEGCPRDERPDSVLITATTTLTGATTDYATTAMTVQAALSARLGTAAAASAALGLTVASAPTITSNGKTFNARPSPSPKPRSSSGRNFVEAKAADDVEAAAAEAAATAKAAQATEAAKAAQKAQAEEMAAAAAAAEDAAVAKAADATEAARHAAAIAQQVRTMGGEPWRC